MMKNLFCACLIAMFFSTPAFAATSIEEPKASSATATGIELPPDQIVSPTEGFVNIVAKCKGEVRWLVIANVKIKYLTYGNSVVVSVPPVNGQVISVFAIGLVDGKMTDFVRTNITVQGNAPNPNPSPNPNPGPVQPVSKKLHVTFLVNMTQTTNELAQLLNSESLRKTITNQGNWFRVYDITSKNVTDKKLDKVAQGVPGSPAHVMVIQDESGKVLAAVAIPKTESEIINIIESLTK